MEDRSGVDEGLERDIRLALGLEEGEEPSEEPVAEEQAQEEGPPAEEQPEEEQERVEQAQDEEPTFEIDGERIKASQIREWRLGYLREQDYTRKTQQIAEERRALEAERARLQSLAQIDEYLRQNPHIAQRMQQFLQQQGLAPQLGAAVKSPQQPVQQPALDPVIAQKLADLERWRYDQELDRKLSEVRRQADADRSRLGLQPLSEAEWDTVSKRIMQDALSLRITDLSAAYRQSLLRDEWFDEAFRMRQQQVQSQIQQRQQEAKRASVVMNGAGPRMVPSPETSAPPKTFEEATRRAYAELKASGTRLFDPY